MASGPKKLKLEETADYIPQMWLNQLGFIKYCQLGNLPWTDDDEGFLPHEYKNTTNFLGIDCRMVGVGHLRVSALGRVSIVNQYGFCVYDTFVNPMVEITDYRTSFSGIRAEDITKAPNVNVVLRTVAQLVKGNTLVGHSIHNILNILKLDGHSAIRDTALYFRKLTKANSMLSLKMLIKQFLNVDIPLGEENSILNAQANIKLYLLQCEAWEESLIRWRMKANILDKNVPLTEIADMHVQPRESDLSVDSTTVFVRRNKIIGAYSSCEEYLDVQFRLLMEDFLRPLRQTVQDIRNGTVPLDSKQGVLHHVRLHGKKKGTAEIKGPGTIIVPIAKNNIADWEESGMFMNGSLLLLSQDNFKSVKFAVISTVKTDGDRQFLYDLPIQVIFSHDGPSWIVSNSDTFSMIESKAFYAAYRHTLEFLQTVDLNTLPLKKYIVDVVTKPAPPLYLRNAIEEVDFSCLMKDGSSKTAKPLDLNNWPSAAELGLDNSQFEALQNALTQELTIIQGPPGTGKTFTSLQVVKMLLTNPWMCQDSPVLIVSYTNHSLDQVLELILDFVTTVLCNGNEQLAHKMILRLGGGSKSEKVEPLTMTYKKMKSKEKSAVLFEMNRMQKLARNFTGLNFDRWLLDMGILNFHNLPKDIISKLAMSYNCKYILDVWNLNINHIHGNTAQWFGIDRKCPPNQKKKGSGLFLMYCNLEYILAEDLPQITSMVHYNVFEYENVFLARWAQYFFLLNQLNAIIQGFNNSIAHLQQQFEEVKHYEIASRHSSSLRIVGLTTTCAAKNKHMIQNDFQSKIMIVEEAAQILEAHVVACLTDHCQQMILIGDHQQLRPLTADVDLGTNYKLNISLMERLIENGKVQNSKNWIQLKQQHRMRPEIAKMICPVIYENLENHPVVFTFPFVSGCDKNIFFVDHNKSDKKEATSFSYYNEYEAKYIVDKLTHFIGRGYYKPDQITVIVAYLAQRKFLVNLLKTKPQLEEVRVSTVDGYQGEENDIVFLSLVRSNAEKQVGFLKQDNRVCVALSRARHGFFMIGNMTCLKSASDTWRTINQILEDTKCIGSDLPLNSNFIKPEIIRPPQLRLEAANFQTWPSSKSNWSATINSEVTKATKVLNAVPPLPLQSKDLSENLPRSRFSVLLPNPKSNWSAAAAINREVTKAAKVLNSVPPLPLQSKDLSENLPRGRFSVLLPNPNYVGLNKKIDCTETITKHLPCGHILTMPCYKYKTDESEQNQVQPCQHEHNLSEYKCTINVITELPCDHWQKSYCHQSPSTIRCDVCDA